MTPPPNAIPSRSASVTERLRSCDVGFATTSAPNRLSPSFSGPRDGQVPAPAERDLDRRRRAALPDLLDREHILRQVRDPCSSVDPWNAGTQ